VELHRGHDDRRIPAAPVVAPTSEHGRGGRSGPQVFLLVDLRQFGADRNEYVNGRNSPHLLDLA
jgi:hypothetical protein